MYVTSQKKLAETVGCSTVHLSRFKNRKVKASDELLAKLSDTTGISRLALATASAKKVDRLFREFFRKQRIESYKEA